MLGVFAEFERVIIRERVNAGLARAKANGNQTRPGPSKAVGGGANTRTQGRWRCHPQDWPETWNRHQRRAAGFQAGVVATLIGTLSGRNGPLPNPADFSFGAGHNVDRSLSIRCSLVRPGLSANRTEQPIAHRSVFEGEEE